MKFKALLEGWKKKAGPPKTRAAYSVRLPLGDAARIHALADLFPGQTPEHLITDLLHAALDEIESAMPYERGVQVISQDEQGDPVYEDVGMTPRFLELARRHKKTLAST